MIVIISKVNKVLKAIEYRLNQEMLEFCVYSSFDKKDVGKSDQVIYISNSSDVNDSVLKLSNDVLIISDKKVSIKSLKGKSNLLITNLINDDSYYTKAQEEYLYRDGVYQLVTEIIISFIYGKTIDKMTYDTEYCEAEPSDWVFKFDSISETYSWLSRRNNDISNVRKVIEVYSPYTYNDSDKEINYLSEYILLAKKGKHIINLYMSTREEFESQKNNIYFDIMARKCDSNVETYFVDIDVIKKKEPVILGQIGDGVALYEDCVYLDTFDDETSLGKVDCKLSSVKTYNEIFDYIVKTYAIKAVSEGEYVRF